MFNFFYMHKFAMRLYRLALCICKSECKHCVLLSGWKKSFFGRSIINKDGHVIFWRDECFVAAIRRRWANRYIIFRARRPRPNRSFVICGDRVGKIIEVLRETRDLLVTYYYCLKVK